MRFSELRLDMIARHRISAIDYQVEHLGVDHATIRLVSNTGAMNAQHVEPDHPILRYLYPRAQFISPEITLRLVEE